MTVNYPEFRKVFGIEATIPIVRIVRRYMKRIMGLHERARYGGNIDRLTLFVTRPPILRMPEWVSVAGWLEALQMQTVGIRLN